jgi:hypothetical protein
MDEVEEIEGRIDYPSSVSATLEEGNGRVSMLAIDKPPLGHFNVEDLAEANSFFRDFLRRRPGDRITIQGIRSTLLGDPIILVIRTV